MSPMICTLSKWKWDFGSQTQCWACIRNTVARNPLHNLILAQRVVDVLNGDCRRPVRSSSCTVIGSLPRHPICKWISVRAFACSASMRSTSHLRNREHCGEACWRQTQAVEGNTGHLYIYIHTCIYIYINIYPFTCVYICSDSQQSVG